MCCSILHFERQIKNYIYQLNGIVSLIYYLHTVCVACFSCLRGPNIFFLKHLYIWRIYILIYFEHNYLYFLLLYLNPFLTFMSKATEVDSVRLLSYITDNVYVSTRGYMIIRLIQTYTILTTLLLDEMTSLWSNYEKYIHI